MTITPEKTITPRDLITPRMFTRLTGRIMADSSLDRHTAERILEQTLAFLAACARNPGARLAPSRDVDKGWHAFLLFTADYAEFCDRVAGRFIHHLPTDPGEQNDTEQAVAATITAMRAAGLHVDAALWNAAPDCTSDCNQCHAGCHDSPHRA
jgi:hypothetical protein